VLAHRSSRNQRPRSAIPQSEIVRLCSDFLNRVKAAEWIRSRRKKALAELATVPRRKTGGQSYASLHKLLQ
jgi:hypothetical protein